MRKIWMNALLMSMSALASEPFESTGNGHYCYQEVRDAALQAESNAEESAAEYCAGQPARQLCAWKYEFEGEACSVTARSFFICENEIPPRDFSCTVD
jgi:hypothetical protein